MALLGLGELKPQTDIDNTLQLCPFGLTHLCHVYLTVPPLILSTDPVEQQVIAGEPVTLGCQTSGDPPPTVRWRKDMRELNFYDPTTRHLLDDTGSLLIPSAEIVDTGRYLCVAENPAGVVTREMNLYVYGRLEFQWGLCHLAVFAGAVILVPMLSSFCNSFEDWAPVNEIYGCPIFKRVAVIWLKIGHQHCHPNNGCQGDFPAKIL